MKIEILEGGSGRWQVSHDGMQLGSGHKPRQAPSSVIVNQLARIANGETFNWQSLGGGYCWVLEIPQSVFDGLVAQATARATAAAEEDTRSVARVWAEISHIFGEYEKCSTWDKSHPTYTIIWMGQVVYARKGYGTFDWSVSRNRMVAGINFDKRLSKEEFAELVF